MNLFGYDITKKDREVVGFGKPIFSILFCERGSTLAGPNGEGSPQADLRMILLATVLQEQFNNNWVNVCNNFPTEKEIKKWIDRSLEYHSAGYVDPFSASFIEILKENSQVDNREVG